MKTYKMTQFRRPRATIELHTSEEIVATETLTVRELRRRFEEFFVEKITHEWKEDLIERLWLNGEFTHVIHYH